MACGKLQSGREEGTMKNFSDLSEREILALAITLEEEDERIYDDFAEGLRESYPASAQIFRDMAAEESTHRHRLIELHRERFGEHIPLIRRGDVRGFVQTQAALAGPAARPRRRAPAGGDDGARDQAVLLNRCRQALQRCRHPPAAGRPGRGRTTARGRGEAVGAEHLPVGCGDGEDETRRRLFVLQVIQPGLAGLMDGSVSTLAPVFAAAFATRDSWDAFVVGLAASIGAGISMGFAEALSDDGSLTGRGKPWLRGGVCGLMTALGGLGHTLPYLIPNFHLATTIAVAVVLVELGLISWIGTVSWTRRSCRRRSR